MNRPALLSTLAVILVSYAAPAQAQLGSSVLDEPGDRVAIKPKEAKGDKPVPNPDRTEKRAKGPTEITAHDADFDNRKHVAIFTTNVVVKDPEFNVNCDKLTAYLKHAPEGPDGKPVAKPADGKTPIGADPAPKSAKKEKDPNGSGLEKAIAEGNVVIIQDKVDPGTGKTTRYLAEAKRAVYEATTGNVTLTGWPKVTENVGEAMSKQMVALEEGCVMVLNNASGISARGQHKTRLQDTSDLGGEQ